MQVRLERRRPAVGSLQLPWFLIVSRGSCPTREAASHDHASGLDGAATQPPGPAHLLALTLRLSKPCLSTYPKVALATRTRAKCSWYRAWPGGFKTACHELNWGTGRLRPFVLPKREEGRSVPFTSIEVVARADFAPQQSIVAGHHLAASGLTRPARAAHKHSTAEAEMQRNGV